MYILPVISFVVSLIGGIELFMKGEIVMTSYSVNYGNAFSYTHMTINHSPVEYYGNYVELLQNSITSFIQYIEQSFKGITRFFEGTSRTDNINGLEEIFLLAKKNFLDENLKLQYDIIHTLNKKKVSTQHYEKLTQIINAHQRMATELIEKEINADRIEIISNYLREVIVYLKTDFTVHQLPDATIHRITFDSELHNEVVIDDYDSSANRNIHVSA